MIYTVICSWVTVSVINHSTNVLTIMTRVTVVLLHVPVDIKESMENNNETVMVEDGANCMLVVRNTTEFNWFAQSDDPIWFIN